MKRFLISLFFAAVLTIPANAYSAHLLSPGLEHFTEQCGMIQSSLCATEICFTRTDFENALGCDPARITITALPPVTDGTLYYGAAPVSVNQTITHAGLDQLRFVPAKS